MSNVLTASALGGLAMLLNGCAVNYDNIDWVNKNNVDYKLITLNTLKTEKNPNRVGFYYNGIVLMGKDCLTDDLLNHELGHLREDIEGFKYHTKYTTTEPVWCGGGYKHINKKLGLEEFD